MARLQQETQAAVTTGSADIAGIPRAMGYGLYVISPGSGLSCPRHPQDHQLANLTPASRRQDHTISPSASSALVSRTEASTASRVRDDREAPLRWRRDAANNHDFGKMEREIFSW